MQLDHARGYLPTKPQAQPAEDVIHHRARLADLGISGPARRLKSRMGEFVAEKLQGNAVLQSNGESLGEAADEARDGRTFLRHGDENLAGLVVRIQAHRNVSLVSADTELVRD